MRSRIVHHGTRRRGARRRRVLWTGGEVLVTVGVVLMLLVVHQLWWTNREAREGARRKVEALERQWGQEGDGLGSAHDPVMGEGDTTGDGSAGAGKDRSTASRSGNSARSQPSWTQAYAILTVPRLHLRVPVAEGVGKQNVLNKGYVGHYPGTGQPGQVGNFALAGHRNTHGEPFRYVNRLSPGDTVQVETRSAVYTYAVDRTLRQTSARDAGVIRPVPRSTVHPSYGYTAPGRFITLTTCTPEYTSRYRLVVWGTLVSTQPR
ncbi:class E sortase [Streptomyces griseorubiginosus]|uniref:class E sortase n=1 Tax=Streptomyces griseorubiginosus TaxID=67304 RepID=UPI00076CA195|nr:class E sortase [Streptomyces griseorubiginosus]KUM68571.1 sortase [Streptomyces griseorubiginosus]